MIVKGEVVHGFGRGSKLLGFPTANLNILDSNTSFFSSLAEGIYYGYSTLNDIQYKSVMSIGLNPTFNTVKKTFEVYLIGYTGDDFYGENLEGLRSLLALIMLAIDSNMNAMVLVGMK